MNAKCSDKGIKQSVRERQCKHDQKTHAITAPTTRVIALKESDAEPSIAPESALCEGAEEEDDEVPLLPLEDPEGSELSAFPEGDPEGVTLMVANPEDVAVGTDDDRVLLVDVLLLVVVPSPSVAASQEGGAVPEEGSVSEPSPQGIAEPSG